MSRIASREPFSDYADHWIDTYTGRKSDSTNTETIGSPRLAAPARQTVLRPDTAQAHRRAMAEALRRLAARRRQEPRPAAARASIGAPALRRRPRAAQQRPRGRPHRAQPRRRVPRRHPRRTPHRRGQAQAPNPRRDDPAARHHPGRARRRHVPDGHRRATPSARHSTPAAATSDATTTGGRYWRSQEQDRRRRDEHRPHPRDRAAAHPAPRRARRPAPPTRRCSPTPSAASTTGATGRGGSSSPPPRPPACPGRPPRRCARRRRVADGRARLHCRADRRAAGPADGGVLALRTYVHPEQPDVAFIERDHRQPPRGPGVRLRSDPQAKRPNDPEAENRVAMGKMTLTERARNPPGQTRNDGVGDRSPSASRC